MIFFRDNLVKIIIGLSAIGLVVLFLAVFIFVQAKKAVVYEGENKDVRLSEVVIRSVLPKNKKEDPTRMLFFGDMMLDRNVGVAIDKNGFDYLFEKLDSQGVFDGYDLVSANLEGAVTNGGEHYAPKMAYDFAFDPELVLKLKEYNFNFFNLSNNHLGDQGVNGVNETRRNLDELGFDYSGCREKNIGECSSKIINVNNKKIGMVGFTMVYGELDRKQMVNIIKDTASSSELVVVNIHFGVEYEHEFRSLQQSVAYDLIDAGADVIIGHHPHVVQGIEVYRNKPIFYSLGNFIFDQYFSEATQEGFGVSLELSESGMWITLLPYISENSQVISMDETQSLNFYDRLIKYSNLDDEYADQLRQGRLKID
jgi:gamma-polyglutamate biosynthesis protein CapA